MSTSFSVSESATFTVTHARHMAAKVATDLKRIQRFYGSPSDAKIANYEAEITAMIRAGYLGEVTYGFRKNGNWIEPTLRYTARDLAGMSTNDDDPGKIRASADVTGASFYSFMTYSASWHDLSSTQRDEFVKQLPFARTTADEPGVDGYLSSDRTYSSGGRALERQTVRSY